MTGESPAPSRSFRQWLGYIWAEGLARHVIVEKKSEGKRPVNLPLTFIIAGGILAPWLLALGVVAAVVFGYSLHVEGGGQPAPAEPEAAVDDAESTVAEAAEKAQEMADAVEDTVEEAVTGLDARLEGEEDR